MSPHTLNLQSVQQLQECLTCELSNALFRISLLLYRLKFLKKNKNKTNQKTNKQINKTPHL